jgi:hypothetical protein
MGLQEFGQSAAKGARTVAVDDSDLRGAGYRGLIEKLIHAPLTFDIVDTWNRFNIALCAGREVGYHYEHGQLIAPADAIQQVLSSDEGRVHAYPIRSSTVTGRKCDDCGGCVLVV